MLRKSFPVILRPIIGFSSSNLLKNTCNSFVTSCRSDNEKSVLADPVVIKPRTPESFNLHSVLTVQQTDTFNSIQNLKNIKDIIQFLERNEKLIVPLYAPLFTQIFQIVQSKNSQMSKELLVKNPAFEKMCKSVKKSARALRPNDILNILKTVKLMNVSMNSTFCQTLLQVLTKTINELGINQLIFINYLIRDAPSSPIVEALKISLPIVFDTNIRAKLNYGDPKKITEALCFGLFKKTSFKSIDVIVEAALAVRDQLTLDQCKDIVNAFLMSNVKSLDSSRRLLYTFCLSKVKEGMEHMSFRDISYIASNMINGFLFADSFFYDEVFLSNVTKSVITNDLGWIDACKLQRSFNRISYVDLDFLNYIDLSLSRTNDFANREDDITMIISFIAACSDARYLPLNWSTYEPVFIDYFLKIKDIQIPLVRIVVELVSLDRWHVPLIEKVFADDFLRQYLNRKHNKLDHLAILNLYRAVATKEQSGVTVLPPADIIDTAINYVKETQRSVDLSPSLELLFNGKSHIANNIMTKYGHFIEHLIVLNKNGEPLPIKEDVQDGQNLENIVLPANGYSFAIVVLSPTCYCIDGVKLRGKFKLDIDTLATQGVIPVPISTTVWESLQDNEKLPFLQREIFSRVPGNDKIETPEQATF
ncbi:uncharacterized protein LOC135846206 [Planococcus citri]|uniref:uncharacterized protein LOC135846206 n=1 Tax=Planococcus citri TaxID=170843 RepID=UPI0031F8CD10